MELKKKHYRYLILGGGPAALFGLRELHRRGEAAGNTAMVTPTAHGPLCRPVWSRAFLKPGYALRRMRAINQDFFKAAGVELHVATPVLKLDPLARQVTTDSDFTFRYEKLLIAETCKPRRLDVPGNLLANLYYLRGPRDADVIRSAVRLADHLVIIGSDDAALEAAASLAGAVQSVSIVTKRRKIGPAMFPGAITPHISAMFERHGVHLYPGEEVVKLEGEGIAHTVRLASGRGLRTDMVLASVGSEVEIAYLPDGLSHENGVIRVDERFESAAQDVFAAGEIAAYPDTHSKQTVRGEHWSNAARQARVCARNMSGSPTKFTGVHSACGEFFDTTWWFWGNTIDADEVRYASGNGAAGLSVWWLHKGSTQAALTLNADGTFRRLARQAVRDRSPAPVETTSELRAYV